MLKSSVPESSEKYYCNICDYNTRRHSQFERHLNTRKHKINTKSTDFNNFQQKINEKSSNLFPCECGKKYKERSGLWRHKKICQFTEDNLIHYNNNDNSDNNNDNKVTNHLSYQDIVLSLINDNKELRNVIIEQSKESNDFKTILMEVIKNGTHNITNTNSHNKSFNLNFFLNETCKDAMNISDFMNSLQIQLSDLENVGEVGYITGISNIIVKNLQSLDVTQRPVHCTDAKREILYIKDENKWEKEDEENMKLRKVIKNVAFKNSRMLPEFRKKYPDCGKSESKFADQYNKLIIEAMGGRGDNDKEKEDKIIKKIAKEVTIEK